MHARLNARMHARTYASVRADGTDTNAQIHAEGREGRRWKDGRHDQDEKEVVEEEEGREVLVQ